MHSGARDARMTGFFKRASPVMIAVGGLSGSGKTTLAAEIGKRMPGAVVIDSDTFRKGLHGIDPKTPLPEHAYSPSNTKQFIRRIHREAAQHLQAGKNVIVTGLFIDKNTRAKQEEIARANGAEFIGIYLHASASVLFDRVAKRKDSASDADKAVLKRQIKSLQKAQAAEAFAGSSAPAGGLRKSASPPRVFRELNWQIINADQPLESMLHSAILYIHQEHQKFRLRLPSSSKIKQKQLDKPKPTY